MSEQDAFDFVVIGGGPAGEKGAAMAAYFGKRVALVEREACLGGAAVNTGTLPSKTLRETCLHLAGIKLRGIGLASPHGIEQVTVDGLMERARAVTRSERERMSENLRLHGVTCFRGAARFATPNELEIEHEGSLRRVRGEKFLIATGSSPHHPPGIAFEHPLIDDSDEFLRLERIPRSLLIVGAGVIGCEYATMFAAIGARVTLIDGRDELLPFLDREVAARLVEVLRGPLAIDLRLGCNYEAVEADDHGVTLLLPGGERLRAERLLVAAGRTGNTAGLGLDVLGLQPDKRGNLRVGPRYRTEAAHVWAAGDVIGSPSLASVSMEQARVATIDAFGLGTRDRLAPLLPFGIYTIPELSSIGETEESARERGLDFETGRAALSRNPRGQIIGEQYGMVKLVFRRSDRQLLGAHVLGESAAELIHIASAVLQLGGTLDAFIEMVFNYPTLSDAFKYAAYDGLGRLAGRPGPSSVTGAAPERVASAQPISGGA
jgi:NAD(P) transhydrogenase